MKKLLFFTLSLSALFTAKSANAMARFLPKSNVSRAAVAAGTAFVATQSESVLNMLRVAALQSETVHSYLQTNHPEKLEKYFVQPLKKGAGYNSVKEYFSELPTKRYLKKAILKTFDKRGIPFRLSNTESTLLFRNNADVLFWGGDRHVSVSKSGPHMRTLNAMLQSEKDIASSGLSVQYHALTPDRYGTLFLETQLDQLANKSQANDFLKLRPSNFLQEKYLQNKYITLLDRAKNPLMSNETILRYRLMKCKGSDSFYSNRENEEKLCRDCCDYGSFFAARLLATSHTFVPQYDSVCAGDFWFRQLDSKKDLNPTIQSLLMRYQMPQSIRESYEKRFAETIQKFNEEQTNTKGANIMLQLGISKNLLDQTSYTSHAGGIKRNVYYRTKSGNVEKFNSTHEYLEQVRKNPTMLVDKDNNPANGGMEEIQYRLILDQDLLLNQKAVGDQFKVKAYTRDQNDIIAFHQKMEHILNDLKEDIKKHS